MVDERGNYSVQDVSIEISAKLVVSQVKHICISCSNHVVQQVPERMVQLEGMAMKHRNELSEAEKNLLESLASQTNLGSLPDEEKNDANFEFCKSHCTQDRQKTPIKRHSAAGIETKASAGTSTQQVRNSNCRIRMKCRCQYAFKLVSLIDSHATKFESSSNESILTASKTEAGNFETTNHERSGC